MSTTSITLPSFAKINLSLRILGKRSDNYHEVRTVLQTVSLHDTIRFTLSESPELVLSCDAPRIPSGEDNLVIRAASALQERFGVRRGASINLEKLIPPMGGLGGGSSNAAVTLVALSHLWNLSPGAGQLVELASELGADVPFFLSGGRALATGIGTTIKALESLDTMHVLIIVPNAEVSTASAYEALSSHALTSQVSETILAVSHGKPISEDSDLGPLRDELENDFERVIFDIVPEIGRAKNALIQAGARSALLAGSGSSVFGIFENREAQQRAHNEIQTESGWRVFPCVTLSREEYLRAIVPGSSAFTLS